MDLIVSLHGIVDIERPGQGIPDMTRAGFKHGMLDLAMFCPEYEHPEDLYDRAKPVLDRCAGEGMHLPVACAPYPARDTKREDLNELQARLAEESIRACGQADCRYLIVKPLFSGVGRGCEWEINGRYYLELADIAKENNVMILLENQCRDLNGHLVRGICSDSREAAEWIDRLNEAAGEERFGFCMDAGICSLCGQDMREFAVSLGSRIRAVILRDCDGHCETSMLPFTCASRGRSATDWLGLIRGLREIDFDGSLIMDFGTTAAAFSPLLRPQLLPLAKAVASYFQWQISMKNVLKKYDKRVLFGAGNMCRRITLTLWNTGKGDNKQ